MKLIKFTLEDSEKERLEKLAKDQRMPLSKYICNIIYGTVLGGGSMETVQQLQSLNVAPGTLKDKCIKIYMSDAEYEMIKSTAGAKPLSTYTRELLFSKTGSKYIFDVKTDDIKELNETVAEINMHIDGFIGGLRLRSDLYEADIKRLETLLQDLNAQVSTVSKELYDTRNSVKKNLTQKLMRKATPFIK